MTEIFKASTVFYAAKLPMGKKTSWCIESMSPLLRSYLETNEKYIKDQFAPITPFPHPIFYNRRKQGTSFYRGEQLGKSKSLRDTNGMLFQNLAMSILICPQVCLWSKNYNKAGFIVMIHVLHNSTLMCSISSYLTLCMTYHNVLRFDVSVYNAMTVKKFNCSRYSKKKQQQHQHHCFNCIPNHISWICCNVQLAHNNQMWHFSQFSGDAFS